MCVTDAPQWLLPAYVRSVRALGSAAPMEQIREAGERLIEMWGTPDRKFHSLRHVIDTLARVDEIQDETHNPDAMRLAVWYHGCVFSAAREQIYRRNGGEDEIASAAYAARNLHELGLPDKTVDRICSLILNLKRHQLATSDIDASALNDADLGVLAVDPQRYKRYRELVRAEYAHIPAAHYLRGRLAIITKLLGRDALFSSPLGARWELPARHNLQAEKRHLEHELSTLPIEEVEAAAGAAAEAAASEAGNESGGPSAAGGAPERGDREAVSSTLGGLEYPDSPEELTRASGRSRSDQGGQTTDRASESPRPVRHTRAASRSAAPREASASAASPQARDMDLWVPESGADSRRERGTQDSSLYHATSMESCVEDLDQLLSRRPVDGSQRSVDRARLAEAERAKLAECLRRKTEEAKVLREARTGELAPITEEIVEDGAGDL